MKIYDQIAALANEGVSPGDIAMRLGRPREYVNNTICKLRKMGVIAPSDRYKQTRELYARIRELDLQGKLPHQIAEIVNRDPQYVRDALWKMRQRRALELLSSGRARA